MSGRWYPSRSRYYQAIGPSDEIEQGDIFWGVPTLVAQHPTIADTFRVPLQPLPEAEALEPPPVARVMVGISVRDDPVIVLPHTCDFYGPEKGRRNRARLVARIQKLAGGGIVDPRLLRTGDGYNYTFFLPSWRNVNADADDMYVNFRFMTSVDAAYLSRQRRVVRLSRVAVIALRRRLAYFFTDYAPSPGELASADLLGGLIRRDRDLRTLDAAPRPSPPSTQPPEPPPGAEES